MISESGSLPTFYSQIIEELSANKEDLSLSLYCTAVQTIRSIVLLEINQDNFTRENLTSEVKKMTGLEIHGPENYPEVAYFKTAILGFIHILKQGYEEARTKPDRLRFFRYGLGGNLTSSSCFEIRYETLYNYYEQSHSLLGAMKFEVQDLNQKKGLLTLTCVEQNEFIEFLHSNGFFENHPIDDKVFQDALEELRKLDLISSDESTQPNYIINEVFSTYSNYGSGLDPFLDFLSHDSRCSKWTQQELISHVDNYFILHPERKLFLF